MPPVVKPRKKKKRKVGRPSFSRKDIPERFFRYYDAYRYGFWNKREFAEHLGVSRPTLDRYFETVNAKPPLVSKAENTKLRKLFRIGENGIKLLRFADLLKDANNPEYEPAGLYGQLVQITRENLERIRICKK